MCAVSSLPQNIKNFTTGRRDSRGGAGFRPAKRFKTLFPGAPFRQNDLMLQKLR